VDNGEYDFPYANDPTTNQGQPFYHSFHTIPEALYAYGQSQLVMVPDKDSFVPMFDDSPDAPPWSRGEQLKRAVMDLIAWTAPHYDPVRGYLDGPGGDLWKVNIIGHCAGGIEARYLSSTNCPLTDGFGNPIYKRIASVTTMVSPHAGAIIFDVIDETIGHNNRLPEWAQSFIDWTWEEIEEWIEGVYGELGPEMAESIYHETQTFMVEEFAPVYQVDPSVYMQGFGAVIRNIYVDRFDRWYTPYTITKLFYESLAHTNGKNDALIHPLSAQGKYVVFKDPASGERIGDVLWVNGMDQNYVYRGEQETAWWYAGVSHIYMNDSPSTHHTMESDGSWTYGVPKEPQVGWSSADFYVEVVDELRQMGF
jgi:hypothetical protein